MSHFLQDCNAKWAPLVDVAYAKWVFLGGLLRISGWGFKIKMSRKWRFKCWGVSYMDGLSYAHVCFCLNI